MNKVIILLAIAVVFAIGFMVANKVMAGHDDPCNQRNDRDYYNQPYDPDNDAAMQFNNNPDSLSNQRLKR